MKKLIIMTSILATLYSPMTRTTYAASLSTPASIVIYGGIVLGAIEGINLLYHAIRSLSFKKRQKPIKPIPPIQTNIPPILTNVIVASLTNIEDQPPALTNIRITSTTNTKDNIETNTTIVVTKRNPPGTPELIAPENNFSTTNRIVQFTWTAVPSEFPPLTYKFVADDTTNIITGTNTVQTFSLGRHRWWIQAVEEGTNTGIPSHIIAFTVVTNRPLFTSTTTFSNLTESEQEDILLFGPDYYYHVSLAYYKVKKYDKSREFMFHSLAIGIRIEDGTAFLKEKFKLSDKQIQDGVLRYKNSE